MPAKLDLAAFLPYQLSIASNAISDRIAHLYSSRFGLRIPEWRLMAVLGQGTPMTQRDLVAATRMDKVTVSRAAAGLNERGLVCRVASDTDRRSHLLDLTAEGRSLYEEIVPAALIIEQAMLACLTLDERNILSSILVRLRDAADRMD